MQEQDIQELLQNSAAEWPVSLQINVNDRHLHVRVLDADTVDPQLATLLAEETQTFIPSVDRITFWVQDATSDRPQAQSTVDLTTPINPEPVSLTQFCFVRNSTLLTIELPPPPEQVVAAVLHVHQLEEPDRLELLQALGTFFDRPDKFSTTTFPPPTSRLVGSSACSQIRVVSGRSGMAESVLSQPQPGLTGARTSHRCGPRPTSRGKRRPPELSYQAAPPPTPLQKSPPTPSNPLGLQDRLQLAILKRSPILSIRD